MSHEEVKFRLHELAAALKLYAGDSEQVILDDISPDLVAALEFLKELPKSEPRTQRGNVQARPNQGNGQNGLQQTRPQQTGRPEQTNQQGGQRPPSNVAPATSISDIARPPVQITSKEPAPTEPMEEARPVGKQPQWKPSLWILCTCG